MKKYFLHELKRQFYPLIALTVVIVLLHVTPLLISNSKSLETNYSHMGTLAAYVGLLAVGVPTALTQYKMKKRSTDLYYALPISHTKVLTARFLIGLILVYVPFTAAYWLGAFVVMARIPEAVFAVWYIPMYFATLIPVYIIYSLTAFVYTRANRDFDGVMFILFWAFALTLVAAVLLSMFDKDDFFIYNYFMPFRPLDLSTSFFQHKLYDLQWYAADGGEKVAMSLGFAVTAALSAAATFGLFFTERNAKAENAGQLSESWFGYRVMIPLYTVCVLSLLDLKFWDTEIFLFIIFVTAAFFINVLYRRTFRIGKKQFIIFLVSVLAGIVLSFIV